MTRIDEIKNYLDTATLDITQIPNLKKVALELYGELDRVKGQRGRLMEVCKFSLRDITKLNELIVDGRIGLINPKDLVGKIHPYTLMENELKDILIEIHKETVNDPTS